MPRSATAKRVFVSYNHENAAQLATLTRELEAVGHEIRHDTDGTTMPPNFHEEISKNIDWADVVVPIITRSWLLSHECRDELVRANERRKLIAPFRMRDIADNGPHRLPFFLRDTHIYIPWSDRDIVEAARDLASKLHSLPKPGWQAESFAEIRQLGKVIKSAGTPEEWRTRLATRVLKDASRRARKVLEATDCSFDLSHDTNYLTHAEPIFTAATNIIAICIAQISTFWTNADFQPRSAEYLRGQTASAKSIARLFVFDCADELVSFKPTLESHHQCYGLKADSGVFLCSRDSYKRLLSQWEMDQEGSTLKEDFGILSFEDSKNQMHAILSRTRFDYHLFDRSDLDDINLTRRRAQNVGKLFERFLRLNQGEVDRKYGVARWSEKWTEAPIAFADGLRKIFIAPTCGVRHYVVLRPENPSRDLDAAVYGLATRFEKEKASLRLLSVNVYRRCESKPFDSRFMEGLGTDQRFAYILRLEFSDIDALNHYYSHHIHSVERERLYRLLDSTANTMFEQLDLAASKEEKQKFFRAIEAKMVHSGRIERFDVSDETPIEELVRRANS